MRLSSLVMSREAKGLHARLKHRLRPRNWLIVCAVAYLHLRYLWFHPRVLERLEGQGIDRLIYLTDLEYQMASVWNRRLGNLLIGAGVPYARCMKRSLIAAHLLGGRDGMFIVIGVLPEKPTEGHAWLELDGEIVAERFDPRLNPYVEIRRIAVRSCEKNCAPVIDR